MQNVKSFRLAMVLVITLSLALGGALACLAVPEPAFAASAKAKVHKKAGWYMCSLDAGGAKAKISGKKLIVKGKVKYRKAPYTSDGWKKIKKTKCVFKLTKKTKYQVRDVPWGGTVKKYGKLRDGFFNFKKAGFKKVLKDPPFPNLLILVQDGKVKWVGWDSD